MIKNTLFLLGFIIINFIAFSEIRLPAIIGDHMVLQQKSEIKLWGWCDPGEKITIKVDWDTTTYKTTGGSNAKWSLNVRTVAAGGPYKILIGSSHCKWMQVSQAIHLMALIM